jgi:hypothetical protein
MNNGSSPFLSTLFIPRVGVLFAGRSQNRNVEIFQMATDSKSKSDQYNTAVARATGGGAAGAQTGELMKAQPPEAAALIKTMSPEEMKAEIAADLASGKFEAAPEILSLKEGQRIEGILEGNGPMAEFTDQDTGEVTNVKTWILADDTGAVRVSILSSAQLDRKLNGFIGYKVKIARGKEVNIAGTRKRMTEYAVWGPRLANGQKRQWFDVSNETRMALAQGNGHKALPAGNVIDVPDVTPTPTASA